jgi:hypothetical protein
VTVEPRALAENPAVLFLGEPFHPEAMRRGEIEFAREKNHDPPFE